MSDRNPRKLLRPLEVADRLGVKEHTLVKWRHEGKGPGYLKIGGLIRHTEEQIEKFLADSVRSNTSQD
ncbi:helix-turn-helix transcriptional regulator [Methylocella sp.]|uniref:helix-turn-helix transcriptional regulator n=1 Tax=Methylocella sp. TaxID=1978226 RepID=UPI003C17FD5D